MTGSPTTFIKEESDDFSFNNPHKFMAANGYNMNQQFSGQFAASNGEMGAINPSELTMSSSMMNNQYGSHMSGSFVGGNSGIDDDELLALGNLDDPSPQFQNFNGYGNNNNNNAQQNGQNFYQDGAVNVSHPGNGMNGQMYSSTPDAAPISSPFVNDFNYNQYRPMTAGAQGFSRSMGTPMGMQNGAHRMHMERHASDSRSPMTPTTPAMRALHLGTPDSGNLSQQAILNQQLHQQAKLQSNQWDQNSGSAGSYLDSPLPSPHGGQFPHPPISEMLASGKHASLPAKVENGAHSLPTAFQSQEAKKKRRRESHNAVERRRRDNINERIHDLSRLVPQHRLEDEKVRKHISNNGPLSPTLGASGISPPHATSLLAGGTGRRAAGNITQGLPLEEKDKGPNKGDILNGAVSWTRDLMWILYLKYQHEDQLKQYVESLGGTWPLTPTEDERRMGTELADAVEKNGWDNFHYSRAPGSGLRVPKHTNYAGEPLSPSSGLSPAGQSAVSGTSTGPSQQQFQNWMNHSDSSGRASFSLKEEDEYGMDMG